MAEQGIEQAAKAGALQFMPLSAWENMTEKPRDKWRNIALAMQPHLARESGKLTALSSEEVNYLADIWRARNTTASLQSQLYDLFEELVERRHPHMRSEPIASDAQASEPPLAHLFPSFPGEAERLEAAAEGVARGQSQGDKLAAVIHAALKEDHEHPVYPASKPQAQDCGDVVVPEGMKKAYLSAVSHPSEEGLLYGLKAALRWQSENSAAREGYVPASELTDEEWLDLCAGDRLESDTIYRSDIDLLLKRRLAPEQMKTHPAPVSEDTDAARMREWREIATMHTELLIRVAVAVERMAEKEAANAVSDQS